MSTVRLCAPLHRLACRLPRVSPLSRGWSWNSTPSSPSLSFLQDSQQVRSIASIIQRPEPLWNGLGGLGGASTSVLGPMAQQVRFAGRKLGLKRKRKNSRTRTVHQKGLGKRMEMYWPVHDMFRMRIPLYENSRRHVIYDHRMKKWMVMWYRNGMQVFRWFTAKGSSFESARTRAILFYKQLQLGGKLGTPKPDQCRSGVRGVFFDKQEKSWVARWSNCGMKTYAMFNTEEMGFQEAYKRAIEVRIQNVRQNHQFLFQRTRWRGQRRPLGSSQT
ncbi:unnamed protein product [Cladocopium goreaui]|uniref:AP2/ERF domain-containing protein n=1 Tax=Cladocopium goreaui TaxID=2562237 RepID=A0A9P1D3M5_9DINO|nr:unnamed protein product [Cladocopium goreaui]|mmetsp:Transcript_70497/g.155452  ORF Transcript_70497/g.155452 Transcript_70497/m.155452 type:complete len:274 (+) Transcript_70497:54-875(+)